MSQIFQTYKRNKVTKKIFVTFIWPSNDTFHYMLKAEFVALVSLKVPSGDHRLREKRKRERKREREEKEREKRERMRERMIGCSSLFLPPLYYFSRGGEKARRRTKVGLQLRLSLSLSPFWPNQQVRYMQNKQKSKRTKSIDLTTSSKKLI